MFIIKFVTLCCLFLIILTAQLFCLCWASTVVVEIFVILIGSGLEHTLAYAFEIQVGQKILEALVFTFQFYKEFLGVATRLSTRPCAHVLLNSFPLFAKALQGFEEPKVFIHSPTSCLLSSRYSSRHLRQISSGSSILV